jgi:hypothetical protein
MREKLLQRQNKKKKISRKIKEIEPSKFPQLEDKNDS